MMSITPHEGEDAFDRAVRTHRLSLSAIVAVVVQTIGLVVWLVQLGADVKQLRYDVTVLQGRIENIDDRGTRALDLVRSRQADVIAVNAAQEMRIREIEQKFTPFDRSLAEINAINKRLEDQQLRLIQALDNVHHLLNQHLRDQSSSVPAPPPILRPQQK